MNHSPAFYAALRELYGGNEALAAAHDPLSLLLGSRFDGLAGRFVTGSADAPARRSAERLIPAAVAAGIDTSVVRARGHHSFRLVESVGPDAFAWLASHLTTPTKPTPTNQI